LGGSDSAAYGVNESGSIVGAAATSGNAATQAFLYRNGAMTSLGTLGGTNSVAMAINEVEEIAGSSSTSGNAATHAFLFQSGTMIDLNTRLPDGSGWVLESATAINSSGDIAGVGTINGERHAYRLSVPVALTLSPNGALSLTDSNIPRGGVQVGRSITFVTSLNAPQDANAHNIVITDTMQGPIEIVGARSYQGNPCTVDGAVVTCRIPVLGPLTSFAAW